MRILTHSYEFPPLGGGGAKVVYGLTTRLVKMGHEVDLVTMNFPIVLLEAMGAGLAIITTQGTGCAEVVGETGMLVPPKNANAIRENLIRLMNDPGLCKQLGMAARKRFEKSFTWDVVTKQYEEIYEGFGQVA